MQDSLRDKWVGIALTVAFACAVSVAPTSAATIQVEHISGNECGEGGFDACQVEGSPVVIKFDASGNVDDINSIFDSIDGSEFEFDPDLDGSLTEGLFRYNPNDDEDPALRFWVAKGGSTYNLHYLADSPIRSTAIAIEAGVWYNWYNPTGATLSHMTFFDTGWPTTEEPPTEEPQEPTPEPGTLALFGLALVGAAYRRRVRQ